MGSWKPYVKQKIEFRKEKNNQYDKYAVAGYTKLPGKMVLCVVGHMPREISRYIWFAMEASANITAQFVSTNTKRSPLTQGGLRGWIFTLHFNKGHKINANFQNSR